MNIVIKETAKTRNDIRVLLEEDAKEAITSKSNKGTTKSGTIFSKVRNLLILM